jgi:hypothetical protein
VLRTSHWFVGSDENPPARSTVGWWTGC